MQMFKIVLTRVHGWHLYHGCCYYESVCCLDGIGRGWHASLCLRMSPAFVWTSLVAEIVKNLLAVQDIQVQSLGWEDPLEDGMATHSGILPWKIPWTKEPCRLQSMGSQRVRHNWRQLSTSTIEKFCVHAHQRYWPVIFCFGVVLV